MLDLIRASPGAGWHENFSLNGYDIFAALARRYKDQVRTREK
jgi:hypothetical protein